MSTDDSIRRDLFKQAVMWHFADNLGKLRQIQEDKGRKEIKRIADIASNITSENPLHMVKGPFRIEGYRDDLSGAQLASVMVASIWLLCGENAEIAGAMVNDWPDVPMFALLAKKPNKRITKWSNSRKS